jgi:Holliday junction resolvase RusA-like endonuclease
MTRFVYIEGINPEPWEAPGTAIGWGKGRKPYVQSVKSGRLEAYQLAIKECVEAAYPELLFPRGVPLRIQFFFTRQLDVYQSTATGRTASRNVADATNMQKATEDALQGILLDNDRWVKTIESVILDEGPDVTPSIVIIVRPGVDDRLDGFKAIRDTLAAQQRPIPPGNVYIEEGAS